MNPKANQAALGLLRSIAAIFLLLAAAPGWHGAASGQSVCGDGVRDFATETCDDGGSCRGGANDGRKCTTLEAEACPDGECIAVDGDLDFGSPGEPGDICPANCVINDTCTVSGGVDVNVKFAQHCACAGDCDGDGTVSLNEVITGIGIGLGTKSLDECPSFDANSDDTVGVTDLIGGVDHSINDCPTDCGLDLTNGRFFLRYPDAKVRIPGTANDNSVIERISVPFVGVGTPNDIEYAIRILLQADPFFTIDPDTLFTVTMDVCQEGGPPAAEDFRCSVFEAFASDASDVTSQTTCSVEIAP